MAAVSCSNCVLLLQRLAALEAEVRELKARLGTNSSNSSLPPSANPPAAPPPVTKTPTGQKRGAQPGHAGHRRTLVPPDQVTQFVHHVAAHCDRCHAALPADLQPGDPPPTRHQVAELPPRPVVVTEHQGHARTCRDCGHVTRTPVPADVRRRCLGPRLTAFLSYLSGPLHVSRRGVTDLVRTAFGVPICLGTVSQREADTSAAVADAYTAAVQAAQAAPVQYQDETGWSDQGQRCWLWTVASDAAIVFQVQVSRSQEARRTLAGSKRPVTVSDRHGAYHDVPTRRRQLCWAHLKRDFQKWVERGDPSRIGTAGQAAVRALFEAWHTFRRTGDRAALQRRLRPVRRALWQVLDAAQDDDDARVVNLAANLLKVWPALWTFARVAGVEPTNNRAERALRPAVVWRKQCQGSASDRGLRFAERILTVAATLGQQGRSVWQYLCAAVSALWQGHPTPSLLTTG